MQYFRQPFKQLSSQQVIAKGQEFIKTRNVKGLCLLLGCDESWLREQAANPTYYTFQAPKGNGSFRIIENPHPKLKDLQRLLADMLQGVYYGIRPRASYAFIPSTADETSPCNIYTNALRHCNSKFILQLDIKDFFHSIAGHRIKEMFVKLPFEFPEEMAHLLAKVTTCKGRLPIGAPSSPVLSNMVCFELDHQLDKLAREQGWTYTRYADDITFSGARRFTDSSVEIIRQHIEASDFVMNYEKTKLSRTVDEPEICGLAVKLNGRPDLSENFVKDLKSDIKTYKVLTSDKMIAQEIFSAEALNRFRQHIQGELAFVRFIKGPNHGQYLKLRYLLADGMMASD